MEINDEALRRSAKELRTRLNLTQAAFAERIGRTIPSILRYETQVAPRGSALVCYAEIAIASQFDDLAALFSDAFLQENGPALEIVMNWRARASTTKRPSKTSGKDPENPAVFQFMNFSDENRRLVEGLCAFMAAENLSPIEELARGTIKQVLLEQPRAVKFSTKKLAR